MGHGFFQRRERRLESAFYLQNDISDNWVHGQDLRRLLPRDVRAGHVPYSVTSVGRELRILRESRPGKGNDVRIHPDLTPCAHPTIRLLQSLRDIPQLRTRRAQYQVQEG